ncbi:hypothetical protein SGRI78S_02696 [Streptomyces griseus subsp. griseus]
MMNRSPLRSRSDRMVSKSASVRYTCGVGASGCSFFTCVT